MQRFNPEKLYPIQQQIYDLIKDDGGALVASMEELARRLPKRRRRFVGKSSVKYALDALAKKGKVSIMPGSSHQKSKISIV